MTTVYLKHERTTDSVSLQYCDEAFLDERAHHDVCIYADPECKTFIGRIPWHYSNKPDRRYKKLTVNCANYDIVWVEDLVPAGG